MPYVECTPTSELLEKIPDLDNQLKITIAVYSFIDKTSQRKPSTKFSQLSTAVTQVRRLCYSNFENASGATFVVERNGLDNLIKERQLIKSTRDLYDETEI